MPHVRSPGSLSQGQQLPAQAGAMDSAILLGQPFPSSAPLPGMQKQSLFGHQAVSTVTHVGTVHNVPIQHLHALCCSTKHFDDLSHCHWKKCEEKTIFQHLSTADLKARCIKLCRSQQLPRTHLLHASSSLQELEVVSYSKVRGYISSRPLCLGREREDFQPSSCENKVNALMLCLFCLPLITFEPVGLVQFNLTEG